MFRRYFQLWFGELGWTFGFLILSWAHWLEERVESMEPFGVSGGTWDRHG